MAINKYLSCCLSQVRANAMPKEYEVGKFIEKESGRG
jgi:hypothetical protein